MRSRTRRPLRYRGVDLAQDTRGQAASLTVALVLSVVAGLTVTAGAGFVIELANGRIKNDMFWAAAALTWLFVLWVLPRTIRAWRTLTRALRTPPVSRECE